MPASLRKMAQKCLRRQTVMSLTKTIVVFVVFSVASSARDQTTNYTDEEPSTDVFPKPIPVTALAPQYTKGKSHQKRNAFNLYYMIEECTKCSAWSLLRYGNYCGIGGSGVAINDIDRCCQQHDNCYDDVINSGCWRVNVYLLPYDWKVRHGAPYCDGENRCRRDLCQCDKRLIECLNTVGCP